MWTKSKIQLINESSTQKSTYLRQVEELLENYNVEDCVIGFDGEITMPHSGFFASNYRSSNIDDLFEHMKGNEYIRIGENCFECGYIYKRLSDCPENSDVVELN